MSIKINCISGPRNISTAIMYSFAQRNDTQVVDEPYYGCYLNQNNSDHPGRNEIIASLPTDFDAVNKTLNEFDAKPVLFIKNMAHHIVDLQIDVLSQFKNVFLIRNPYPLIASFAQVMPNPSIKDIGVKDEYELYIKLNDPNAIIIDSGELLNNPENILRKLCLLLKIDFDKKMLSWEIGGIKEDGVWAKHWYSNVHQSTGFVKQSTSDRQLPAHCHALYEEAKPYYDKLYSKSIKN
ncbi:MAG: sulfotransferase family protein [Cyclobacteriaceae bacterium]|nr:sulfotransferase family protein [Cyclobacteriaceae bacterium]